MAYIKKTIKGDKIYYYMEYSYFENKSNKKITKYIGKKLPNEKNLLNFKNQFYQDLYATRWHKQLDLILENFQNENQNLPISVLKKQMKDFGIRFTYNSNKIEGSTLKLRDTQLLLDDNISPPNKPMKDVLESKAHKKIFDDMVSYGGLIDKEIILSWHYDLFEKSDPEIAGSFRTGNVLIESSSVVPPHYFDLPNLLEEFFDWIQKQIIELNYHPVVLASLAHQKFVTIHPFYDGNGRISRLLQNYILNKFNFPMMIIDYSKRNSYYKALERSNIKNDPHLFVMWFIKSFLKTYTKMSKIKNQ